jgi:ribosome assembly protein 1
VYGVVARRRGRIVAEEMKEGTSFFTVSALLPVVESFGLAVGGCYLIFVKAGPLICLG